MINVIYHLRAISFPPAGVIFGINQIIKKWLERLLLEHNVYHIKIISGTFIK